MAVANSVQLTLVAAALFLLPRYADSDSTSFDKNLIQGGVAFSNRQYQNWITDGECTVANQAFTVDRAFFWSKTCTMTQDINLTWANSLLISNSTTCVTITLTGYIRGGDPDFAKLSLQQLPCADREQAAREQGGKCFDNGPYAIYTWKANLSQSACSARVSLVLQNEPANFQRPYATNIQVVLTTNESCQINETVQKVPTDNTPPDQSYSLTADSTSQEGSLSSSLSATPALTLFTRSLTSSASVSTTLTCTETTRTINNSVTAPTHTTTVTVTATVSETVAHTMHSLSVTEALSLSRSAPSRTASRTQSLLIKNGSSMTESFQHTQMRRKQVTITLTASTSRSHSAPSRSRRTHSTTKSSSKKSPTPTASLTIPLPVPFFVDPVVEASRDGAASMSAIATVFSPFDVSQLNTLVMISHLDCRMDGKLDIDSMRDGSLSSYMISPFMDFGWVAVAWGNLALSVVGGFGVSAVVTTSMLLARSTSTSTTAGRSRRNASAVVGGKIRIAFSSLRSAFLEATTTTKFIDVAVPFPSLGLRALELWVPGTVFASVATLQKHTNSATSTPEIVAAALSFICAIGILVAWQATVMRRVVPHVTFVSRELIVGAAADDVAATSTSLLPSWVPWWLLPIGLWCPPTLRNRYSQMFSAHAAVWAAKLRFVFYFGLSATSSMLTSVSFISSGACQTSCVVLALFHFGGAVVFVVGQRHKNFRFPFEVVLTVSIHVLLGVQCIVVATKRNFPPSIIVIEVCLSVLRTALRLFTMVCIDVPLQAMYDRSMLEMLDRGFTSSDDDENRYLTAARRRLQDDTEAKFIIDDEVAPSIEMFLLDGSLADDDDDPFGDQEMKHINNREDDDEEGPPLEYEWTVPLTTTAGDGVVGGEEEEDNGDGGGAEDYYMNVEADDDDDDATLRMLTLLDDGFVDGDRIYLDMLEKALEADEGGAAQGDITNS